MGSHEMKSESSEEKQIKELKKTNDELIKSLEYLRSCYDLELLNKAKLGEEIEGKDKQLKYCHERMALAYSEIEQLQSELSEAKERELEKSKWISVNDRLPEVDINVLCLTDMGEMCVTSFSGKYDKPKLKKGVIWNDPTGYYSPTGDIDYYTHWMELPKKIN